MLEGRVLDHPFAGLHTMEMPGSIFRIRIALVRHEIPAPATFAAFLLATTQRTRAVTPSTELPLIRRLDPHGHGEGVREAGLISRPGTGREQVALRGLV